MFVVMKKEFLHLLNWKHEEESSSHARSAAALEAFIYKNLGTIKEEINQLYMYQEKGDNKIRTWLNADVHAPVDFNIATVYSSAAPKTTLVSPRRFSPTTAHRKK